MQGLCLKTACDSNNGTILINSKEKLWAGTSMIEIPENISTLFTLYYADILELWLIIGNIAFLFLFFVAAPCVSFSFFLYDSFCSYGKHSLGISKWWGPIINGRWAFLFQEMPGIYMPIFYYITGTHSLSTTIFLILWFTLIIFSYIHINSDVGKLIISSVLSFSLYSS